MEVCRLVRVGMGAWDGGSWGVVRVGVSGVGVFFLMMRRPPRATLFPYGCRTHLEVAQW